MAKAMTTRHKLDFRKIRTFSAKGRRNLVTIENLLRPGAYKPERPYEAEHFAQLCDEIVKARHEGAAVVLSMGAHVIKCGLSPFLIALMHEGWVTHIAGNGACSIHDFELAYLGGTSEYVPDAIEDGSFGMWEETGAWMNKALKDAHIEGLGYGESLARFVDSYPDRFPHKEDCVFYQAYRHGVPATYHIAIGTDIIHQHPSADFAAIGYASGMDFSRYCESVAALDGGVFLNFGSGVIGPEVFLKALSIARNLGYPVKDLTTANFDLRDLGDYKKDVGYDDPDYYYRPRKNIVNRPTKASGRGWHFVGDHTVTLPSLYYALRDAGAARNANAAQEYAVRGGEA